MSFSLPADPPRARSLTGVVPQMSAALEGRSDWFAPATSAVVLVLDGVGSHNLSARAGHARFLAQSGTKRDVARSVFPSTTASALTSLLTGALPGEHGIVGYRARVPGTDDVLNQLRGWDTDGLPLEWQRSVPLSTSLGTSPSSWARILAAWARCSSPWGWNSPSGKPLIQRQTESTAIEGIAQVGISASSRKSAGRMEMSV